MLINFYRFLGRHIPSCVLKPFFWKRARLGKEIPERQGERFGRPRLARPPGFLVWIHGASVGELASIRSVVNRLLAYHPSICILLTSGTVASAQFVKPWLNKRCLHQFTPYDLKEPIQGFLDHWRPDLTLWLESELWPNFLEGLRQTGKPAYLLNGRMSYGSFRRWKKLGSGIKEILSTFSIIFAQSPEQKERFELLGAPLVQMIGHLKLVNSSLDVDKGLQQKFLERVKERPWIMAASTHPGEEKILFQTFHLLKEKYPGLLMVIAPRHTNQVSTIVQQAKQHHLATCLHSDTFSDQVPAQVYIIDCIGVLGSFYALKPITVMGGSFVPLGGHNFAEALQLGALAILGPHMHKQVELMSFFDPTGCLIQVKTPSELAEQLDYYLSHPAAALEKVLQAQAILNQHATILDKLISSIMVSFPHDAQSA